MSLTPDNNLHLVRAALTDFPRPDRQAETLLRQWFDQRGVTTPLADIEVVTLHYQYTRLEEDENQFRLTGLVTQRIGVVEALLSNWQGEPATGYNGFHFGDWAGIAPIQDVTLVPRLDPGSRWSNAAHFLIFNGLYRKTPNQVYGPTTHLRIRAEDFQGFIWNLDLHTRYKQDLDIYWASSLGRYRRAWKIAYIAACNHQVEQGSLSEPARKLIWQSAGLVPSATTSVQCSLLDVYGYISTSIVCIKAIDHDRVVLYVPGNSSPFHEFDNLSALKSWFARQCQDSARRDWLQDCFAPADWPDGLEFSGLRTALIGLGLYPKPHRFTDDHPGFATSGVWSPDATIEYLPRASNPLIDGDLFTFLTQRQKDRSYLDADYRIVTNHQVDKSRWGSYLSISLAVLAPFALILPELAPVLLLGGLAQFSLGLDQAINGHTLDEKVEGMENQVFGLLNAGPLTVGVVRASALFRFLRPGFCRSARLGELLGEPTGAALPADTFELLPAQFAFRPPQLLSATPDGAVVGRVDEAMRHYFKASFETANGIESTSVVYDLQNDSFIKTREYGLPAPERWVIDNATPRHLVRQTDFQRSVSDAQRMATLGKLGIHLDLPLDYAVVDNLTRTPIPRAIYSVWVGDKTIPPHFLGALTHNAKALEGTDYQYHLFLSRQNPRVYQANLTQLRTLAPNLQVLPLEDEGFYLDFSRSPYFRQYQLATGTLGAGATNFSSASDILRYRLLKYSGGIYLDADDRLLATSIEPGKLALANHILSTTPDGLILSPPVSSDQLGLYIKYNGSMIGSHADNPTLDAVSEEIHRRFALDPDFYTARPDPDFNPVAFNAYARRLNRLTGPGVLNDVIDARLPWLKQLREMCNLLASPIHDVHNTLDLRVLSRQMREHVPLDRFFEMGQAHSWQHT